MRILTAPIFTLLLISGGTGNVLAQSVPDGYFEVLLPSTYGSAGFNIDEEALFILQRERATRSESIDYLGPANFMVTIANTGDVPISSSSNPARQCSKQMSASDPPL